jgi:Ca-activated chloride channel family protein
MPVQQGDYYSILGVPRDASQEDIKRAYLLAAQKLHPDKNTVAGETELFLDTQVAYETLSNPKGRAQYDATLSPEEKIDLPYEYDVIYSRSNLVRLDEPQMLYIILDLQAPVESRRNPSPPLNVCIVLDRSTSMKGEKMDVLKSAATQILRNLRQQDILSVVAFSDRAEVIVPASYHQDRSRLEARIQMIQPSGGTEMFQGLDAGAKEVMRSHDAKRLNHIILLTDGQTYGDEQKCLDLASKLAGRNVGISAMGIGEEWNDSFLDVLATRTGGSSTYMAEPQDIRKLLIEKFNTLAQTYAEDVLLEPQELNGIKLSYIFRLQPNPTPIMMDEPVLRLGQILQDTTTRVIFEYVIDPTAVKSELTTILDGMLKVSISAKPFPVPPFRMHLQRSVSDNLRVDTPPKEILQALSHLMLYRMQERARVEIEKGNMEAGTHQLQTLAANLLTQGERSLAQTIMLEVEHIQQNESLSEEGSKKIKYGTRALFLAPPKKEFVS